MLERNTMQLGQDSFEFRRQALLKTLAPLDFTYETSIDSLQISGTEPEGSSRRVIFKIDDRLYKFTNGSLEIYAERGEFEDILRNGNTVGELLALNADSLASFIGKKVYPVIALDSPAAAPVMPKIKISANVKNYNDLYTATRYSPIFELKCDGEACKIVAIQPNIETNGNGIVNLKCRLRRPIIGWSDWIDFIDAANQPATAIQLQVRYVVTTMDGSDLAQINNVGIIYVTDAEKLSGTVMEIVTAPQEYYSSLETVYALIKTNEVADCELKAYANFGAPNIRRENVALGTATGAEQTVQLIFNGELDTGVVPETIRLTVGGKVVQKFDFDTQAATLTFTGESGAAIVASYERSAGDENWIELAQDFSLEDEGVGSTRFIGRLEDTAGKSVSAVKFRLIKKSGSVENEVLGVGTGKEQIFALPHHAKAETIQCTGGSWKYDEAGQILRVVAGINESIAVSYEWEGAFPAVKNYIVGWTAAV